MIYCRSDLQMYQCSVTQHLYQELKFQLFLQAKNMNFSDSYFMAQYFILHSTIFLTYWLLQLFAKIGILEMISIAGCFQVGYQPI